MAADATAAEVDSRVAEILKKAHQTARKILEENEEEMHVIAAFLLERETITGEEFMELLNKTRRENGKATLPEQPAAEEDNAASEGGISSEEVDLSVEQSIASQPSAIAEQEEE